MQNRKPKKNNTQHKTNSVNSKTICNSAMEEKYQAYYADHSRIMREQYLELIDNDETARQVDALAAKLDASIIEIEDIIKNPDNKNKRLNDTRLTYIKMLILRGKLYGFHKRQSLEIKTYFIAIEVLRSGQHKLNYKNDASFQMQVQVTFIRLKILVTPTSVKNYSITAEALTLDSWNFIQQCGDTIVKLNYFYTLAMRLISEEKNTTQQSKPGDIFNRIASNLKYFLNASCTTLTIQQQVHFIQLYSLMLNMCEATNIKTIWKVVTSDNKNFILSTNENELSLRKFHLYFDDWLTFKKQYITPAILLIGKMNLDELSLNLELSVTYKTVLQEWMLIHARSIQLFKFWAEKKLDTPDDRLKEKNNIIISQLKLEITTLEFEVQDIATISKRLFVREQAISEKQSEGFKSELADVRSDFEKLKSAYAHKYEKYLSIKTQTANELISDEKQAMDLMEQKIMKKRAVHGDKMTIKWDKMQDEVSDSDNNDAVDADLTEAISPVQKKLESIDAYSIIHTKALVLSIKNLNDTLTERKQCNIPLSSEYHFDVLNKFNILFIEYHRMLSLYEAHISLSQSAVIKCKHDLQQGIKWSQTDLHDDLMSIYNQIQLILVLIDEIRIKQEKSKNDVIIKHGLKCAENYPDTHFTEEEIFDMGFEIYKEIGRAKRRNNQEYSEYTKQKNFLDSIELTYSGLEYLQNKLKTYTHTYNNDISFFNLQKSQKFCYADYEGLIGLIAKQQYHLTENTACLQEALLHFTNALTANKKINNVTGLCNVSYRLGNIHDILANKNQALDHYREALSYHEQSEFIILNCGQIDDIKNRINDLSSHTLCSTAVCL